MSFRIARMDGGRVAEIFTEGKDKSVFLPDGRNLNFKHPKTWVKQGDQMATRYSLVEITTPAQPAFNSQKQVLRLVQVKVGDSRTQDAWEVVDKPSAEVRSALVLELKGRAWDLWGRSSWDKSRTAWLDHRDALKTHGVSLLAAFDQGKVVDAYTGSVDGAGAWPV